MAAKNFTPGPWLFEYGEYEEYTDCFWFHRINGNGKQYDGDLESEVLVGFWDGSIRIGSKKNANLIIAAPELYEALEATLAQCLAWQGEPNEHSCEIHAEIVKKARAALKLARGES